MLFSASSFATLTITSVQEPNNGAGGTALSNIQSGNGSDTAYYAAGTATSSNLVDISDSSVADTVLNLTQTQPTSNTAIASADVPQAMFFNITESSLPSVTSTQHLSVVATVSAAGASTNPDQHPIPIAFVNNTSCPGSGANGGDPTSSTCDLWDSANNFYYYGAPINTSTGSVSIGIFPADICSALMPAGALTSFCSSSSPYLPTQPTGATLTQIAIKFYIVTVNNGANSTNSTLGFSGSAFGVATSGCGGTSAASPCQTFGDSSLLTVAFQAQGGANGSCPSQNGLYIPNQGNITLNLNGFSIPSGSGTADPETAPAIAALIPYAQETTVPTSSVSGSSTNLSPLPAYGSGQTPFASAILMNSGETTAEIGGFTDSDPSTSYLYQMEFLPRDYAGFYATGAACPLYNVRTTEVQAFLNSSKCFIATAAYRSTTAAPVVMLRAFRDQILLHFSLGKAFVHWYYDWSPPAAEWLMDHSEFRYPVLVALIPVEAFAWSCLHPLIALALAGFALTLFLGLRRDKMQRSEQAT